MCFSAPASFIASGGLVLLGGASLSVAKKEDKILAIIPFVFGIQQFIEGVQWLYLNSGSSSLIAGYSFLFFALIFWPFYVPFSVFLLDKKEQKSMLFFVFLGIIVSLFFLLILFTEKLTINKFNACVSYNFYFPFWKSIIFLYTLSVVGPLFLSKIKIFRWYGVVVFILGLISSFFFVEVFTSVWCFFAAIVSSMFFLYIKCKK